MWVNGLGGGNFGRDFLINGLGSTISTGIAGALYVPFACTITASTLVAPAQSGSIVIDIWKVTRTAMPAVDGNSIVASAPPTLSRTYQSQDTTLTGWTTLCNADDVLVFNVDSVASLTEVTLTLSMTRN